MSLPDGSVEAWRYSAIEDLDLDSYAPVLERPEATPTPASDGPVCGTVTIVDGWVTSIDIAPAWSDKGLSVGTVAPEPVTLDDSATIFDHLHQAFAPETLRVVVPSQLAVTEPLAIFNHHSEGSSLSFPTVEVEAGEASELSIVEYQTSGEGGVSVGRLRIDVASAANLRYATVQETAPTHVQLNRLRSTVGAQARLLGSYASFGGKYARVRTDISLDGRGANGDLVAAYYGDGDQVLDFRTFQHHKARDTRSDLLFKGSVDDTSGSVYTGMIQIHPDGAGSNAFQTNRNIKLSEDAWAWSVPNLEIENNDVRCSHASTVNPIDTDQQFYLQARGVPPTIGDRLIVAGFFDEAINRLGVPAAQQRARQLINDKLNERGQ